MSPSILDLARNILSDAESIDTYFQVNGLQQTSFDINGPTRIVIHDQEISKAHQRMINSSRELHHLALGPAESLRTLANVRGVPLLSSENRSWWLNCQQPEDPLVLSIVHRFNIAQHIPLEGHASFEDISKATGLPQFELTRFIRFATTSHIFREPIVGMIAHTAASRLLLEDPLIQGVMDLNLREYFAGCSKV